MNNLFTFAFTASFMVGGITASAQTEYKVLNDFTNKLTNADFMADSPLSGIEKLATYDYDMPDQGAGADGVGRFGLQAITGWTANIPSDNIKVMESSSSEARTDNANAKAAGIFAYLDDSQEDQGIGLGGSYFAPYITDGMKQGVGLVAVWGAEAYYTQDVTLPAGAYMLVAKVQNTSGTQALDNRFGFVASDTEKYYSTKTTFGVNEWENDTVLFMLDKETSGKISFGYKSTGAGSAANQHLYYDNIKVYQIDKTPLIKAQIDELKKDLLATLETAEFNGVDTKAEQAVYDDENATLEQVQQAIDDLNKKIKDAQTDLSAFFLRNPHFTADEPVEGGICTYAKDKEANGVNYSGMQPLSSWTANNPSNVDGPAAGVFTIGSGAFVGGKDFIAPESLSDGSTEGKVLGLVTSWGSTAVYTQGVTIPAGNYTLNISYYNAGGTTAIGKNLIGFKPKDNDVEYYGTSTTFPVGKWTSETVTFTLEEETEGEFSLGYTAANTGSGNMPHLFVDGVTLYYAGDMQIDPSVLALQASVNSAKNYEGEYFSEELGNQLSELIEAGEDLIDSGSEDAEANTAAANKINDLLPLIDKNITAYKNLQDFRDNTLDPAIGKYENIENLYQTLQDLYDNVDEAYNDRLWSTEKIDETINSLTATIKNGIQTAFDAAAAGGDVPEGGLGISELYDQLAYTYSTSAVSNTDIPDKEWSYGDATNFKTQYGTAEVWNQSPFTVSRTLKDMPAGTYTITAKGFFRNSDNQTNADNYDPEKTPEASVFAGHAKTGLTNIATLTLQSDEAISGWAALADGSYVPNSQSAAHDLFNDSTYTDAIDKSTLAKSVSTVLTEKGDLTFGVKADQMEANSWVVWYSFDIKYSPIDNDALNNELAEVIKEAKAYLDENAADNMNSYGAAQGEIAIEAAENKLGSSTEEMAAAIKDAEAAIAAMKANVTAVADCNNAYDEMNTAAEAEGAQQTPAALAAFNAASDKYGNYGEMSTEDLVSLVSEMQYAAALFRIPDYSGASDDNAIDMTSAIVNPSFEDEENGLRGWTYYNGQDTQAADNSNATYATEGVDGNKIFNTWSSAAPEGGFYVSQVIKALPAGTYELTALVASDLNNVIGISAGSTAEGAKEYGYAITVENEKNVGKDISAIFTVNEGEDITIKVSSATWFKTDNFRLFYFGNNSKKETTGIEGTADEAGNEIVSIVNVAGAKVNTLVKGVNIVTYKNGITKKVILK